VHRSYPYHRQHRQHIPAPVQRILRLFRPHRGKLLVVALLVGLSSLVSVASPFLLREVLDVATPRQRLGLLSLLILGMIAVSVATSVFNVGQTYRSTQVGQRVMHDLRFAVYARLQWMSLAFFTRTRTGEMQSRIANDIGNMQATVTSTATSLVSNLTTVVATVIAMLVLDWRLTVVSLLLLPIFVLVSRRVGSERKRITAMRQEHLATMSADVQESLSISGILLGRTMARANSLTDTFAAESAILADLEINSSMAGRWRMACIQIVMTVLPALVYWSAGITSALGVPMATLGTLIAFTTMQQALSATDVHPLRRPLDHQVHDPRREPESMQAITRLFG
jgi:ATP-binding cassette subfamily B protein